MTNDVSMEEVERKYRANVAENGTINMAPFLCSFYIFIQC